ncbi:hypothetical protein [Amycolatopsis plumensis]|uniref:hypothetical protein n=1 Tax=Amycolatopsis plumensis TaxID=236508 RepID=UPI00361B4BF8
MNGPGPSEVSSSIPLARTTSNGSTVHASKIAVPPKVFAGPVPGCWRKTIPGGSAAEVRPASGGAGTAVPRTDVLHPAIITVNTASKAARRRPGVSAQRW